MIDKLLSNFCSILDIQWEIPIEYKNTLEKMLQKIGPENLESEERVELNLLESINKKFSFNKKSIKSFIDSAATNGYVFNYHQKEIIRRGFNRNSYQILNQLINKSVTSNELVSILKDLFTPCSKSETLDLLKIELQNEKKRDQILRSLISAYIYTIFPQKEVHLFNNELNNNTQYQENYFQFLLTNYEKTLSRTKSLVIIKIDQKLYDSFPDKLEFLNTFFSFIEKTYSSLDNHCYFAIELCPISDNKTNISWELYSHIVLFSEKFKTSEHSTGYFHPKKIKETTASYIPELNISKSQFHVLHDGFKYQDCIILSDNDFKNGSQGGSIESPYSLLLLLEKNERDETHIPCPSCRSLNIRGNSYPKLGVRSWECQNLICPDKSKYNRGKRYSLYSLIRQEAIDSEVNEIKNGTLKDFQLDLILDCKNKNTMEFLIKHYSLYGDTVYLYNYSVLKEDFGRKIVYQTLDECNRDLFAKFYDSSFFKRFLLKKQKPISNESSLPFSTKIDRTNIINGDSYEVLSLLDSNLFDGSVTSPPYYNAKEYSQWPNIYCYLFDIYNNAQEVYRTLKPGSIYLFNIFDYFDNENDIVFSAMGKKRMILGAYIIFLFQNIGFEIVDNIIWFKGHIQGNRNKNQGNKSPYYQSPLNCYEHIFVFKKPGSHPSSKNLSLPKIVKLHPVVKYIKGKNILGHSAPYPERIPELLTDLLSKIKDPIILDPYAGSFTTSRVAEKKGIGSTSIEMNKEYCLLGEKLIRNGLSKK